MMASALAGGVTVGGFVGAGFAAAQTGYKVCSNCDDQGDYYQGMAPHVRALAGAPIEAIVRLFVCLLVCLFVCRRGQVDRVQEMPG